MAFNSSTYLKLTTAGIAVAATGLSVGTHLPANATVFTPATEASLQFLVNTNTNVPTNPAHDMLIEVFGDQATNPAVKTITDANARCSVVTAAYQADCMRQALKKASSRLKKYRDYDDARKILDDAAAKIDALIKSNADAAAPIIKKKGRKYTAVTAAAVKKVNNAAAKIVAETETQLIRSAGNSGRRQQHYTRIAQAVGSTKSLLRS